MRPTIADALIAATAHAVVNNNFDWNANPNGAAGNYHLWATNPNNPWRELVTMLRTILPANIAPWCVPARLSCVDLETGLVRGDQTNGNAVYPGDHITRAEVVFLMV